MVIEVPLIPRLDNAAFANIHPELADSLLRKVIEIGCKHFDDSLYKQRCLMLKGRVHRQLTQNDFARRVIRFISERMFAIRFLREDFMGLAARFAQTNEKILSQRLSTSIQSNYFELDRFANLKTLKEDRPLLKKIAEKACEQPLFTPKEIDASRELLVEAVFEALLKGFHILEGLHDHRFNSLSLNLCEWVVILENVIWMNTLHIRRMNKGAQEILREFISDLGNGLFDESVEDFMRGILERAYRSAGLSTSWRFLDLIWIRLVDQGLPFYENNRIFPYPTMLFWAAHDYLDERWLVESLEICMQKGRDIDPLEELEAEVANQIAEKMGIEVIQRVLNPFIQALKLTSFGLNVDLELNQIKTQSVFDFQSRHFLTSPFSLKLNESLFLQIVAEKKLILKKQVEGPLID